MTAQDFWWNLYLIMKDSGASEVVNEESQHALVQSLLGNQVINGRLTRNESHQEWSRGQLAMDNRGRSYASWVDMNNKQKSVWVPCQMQARLCGHSAWDVEILMSSEWVEPWHSDPYHSQGSNGQRMIRDLTWNGNQEDMHSNEKEDATSDMAVYHQRKLCLLAGEGGRYEHNSKGNEWLWQTSSTYNGLSGWLDYWGSWINGSPWCFWASVE